MTPCDVPPRLGASVSCRLPALQSRTASRSASQSASRTSDRTSESRSLRLLPLVPACLAHRAAPPDASRASCRSSRRVSRLAACLSCRFPILKHRVAKRITKRLTNLSPHIRIVVAERRLPFVSTCLARVAPLLPACPAPLADRPDVSGAPRGVPLLPAHDLQASRRAPHREAHHEAPHEPQPAHPNRRR